MKYLKQFMILLVICLLAEALHLWLPLPVPASIYGLLLMLAALCLKIIKLSQIEETADFFLEIMPVLFVGPTIRLLEIWGIIKPVLVPYLVIVLVSTLAGFAAAGLVTQWLHRRLEGKKGARQ